MSTNFQDGKKSFFLVPTKVLVTQQANQLWRHINHKIGEYHGDMNVDVWDKEKWDKEVEEHDILVMTAQVFLDILQHGYFHLEQANLLVFDECHHTDKNHPYKKIMDKFADKKQAGQPLPKVLGLTAALLKSKTKEHQIAGQLKQLEEDLRGKIEIPEDPLASSPFSARPPVIIVDCPSFFLSDQMKNFSAELDKLSEKCKSSETDIEKNLGQLLLHIKYVLVILGPWCAGKMCTVLKKTIQQQGPEIDLEEPLIKFCLDLVDNIVEIVTSQFGSNPTVDHILDHSPGRVGKLLQILREQKGEEFSAIIFVELRIVTYALKQLLKYAAKKEPEHYGHVTPEAMIGYTRNYSLGSSGDDYQSLAKFQEKVLVDFEQQKVNILVSTNVLEEGVDIRCCNCVIRFDVPKDFCSYVQSRGRARQTVSSFFILVEEKDKSKLNSDLDMFKRMEKKIDEILHKKFLEHLDTEENGVQTSDDDLMPPLRVENPSGTISEIKMSNAIPLLSKYCGKLPKDMFTQLQPEFQIEEVKEKVFQATLKLPPDCPVKTPVVSPEMPRKKLAKMAAALMMCKELHKCDELDEYLLPKHKHSLAIQFENLLEDDVGEENPGLAGTRKRKQSYRKHNILQEGSYCAAPNQAALSLTIIKLTYEEIGSAVNLGILSGMKLPRVPPFQLHNSSGPISVELIPSEVELPQLALDQLCLLQEFHKHIFSCWLAEKVEFCPENSVLVVPVKQFGIDWSLVEAVAEVKRALENWSFNKEVPKFGRYVLAELDLAHSVLVPWYRNPVPPKLYIPMCIEEKGNATSPFPDENYKSYCDYFKRKYSADVSDTKQPLIAAKIWKPKGVNYLKPAIPVACKKEESRDRSHNYRHHLLPELVLIHPISQVLWEEIWLLPSLLYRFNGLLLAKQLCYSVNFQLIFVGSQHKFHALESVVKLSDSVGEPKRQKNGVGNVDVDQDVNTKFAMKMEESDDSSDLFYSFDEELDDSSHDEAFLRAHLGISCSNKKGDSANREQNFFPHSLQIAVESPVVPRYDERGKIGDSSDFPVHPALVLQALTTTSANDSFNLEKLEILGDSYLKLLVTHSLFKNNPLWHEGYLTNARTALVCNRTLYILGKRKGIGSLIQNDPFHPRENWLPPGFQACSEGKNVMEQVVSDKSIADSVEALIGSHLICCGPSGVEQFLKWLGLEEYLMTFTSAAGGDVSKPDVENLWAQKGFSSLEQQIGYQFKDRHLLVQAFIHSSYQEWTPGSYQRLEFLGDAVLDYLIMRYCYGTCEKDSPGYFTDLRSALVTNELFAQLSVKYGFQKLLIQKCYPLFKRIERFVRMQEQSRIPMETLVDEKFSDMPEEVEAPKALGDIFESLVGAIFLDSSSDFTDSLTTVWQIVYPMVSEFIEAYKIDPPKNILRKLYEFKADILKKEWVKMEKDSPDSTQVKIGLKVNGELICEGVGKNGKDAKINAAKKGLQILSADKRLD